jgi:1,4-alpha-glucan branching enzyme
VDDQLLRYKFINLFDGDMQHLEAKYGWLHSDQAYISLKNEIDKMVVYERAGLLFVFNFHTHKSYTDYRVGVDAAGEYRVVLNSDNRRYGGQGRVEETGSYFTSEYIRSMQH